ncbi:hypothetical protein QEZ54_35505 [Catellatospora sp. KI3]|uniref:hypothetical protein n=1 Tax=Catellatospora sp. KI3 TaxID=3041620 RepID=UPI0024830C75|nr:hypothetical protein [Catellatospora sp. KI3]MDI1466298.1 hypothetical protein [Catellatospora sp. KI3]
MQASAPQDTRVVLLQEQGWPRAAGVCCWRRGVRDAFAAAGAKVDEVGALTPPRPEPSAGARGTARLGWLPGPVRRPVGFAYRGSRYVARNVAAQASELRNRAKSAEEHRRLAARIGRPALVLAESPALAALAVAAGVPAARIWVLALPTTRLYHDDPSVFGQLIAQLAPSVGGFVTDSETARESVERAASPARPQVLIYPPLAADEPCPDCGTAAPGTGYDEPGQLATWRGLLDQGGGAAAYSFAADRAPRAGRTWARGDRWDWTQSERDSSWDLPAGHEDPWTVQAQRDAARAVLAAALPMSPAVPRPRRRTLIAGYDLKFARELASRLDNRTDLSVDLDEWARLGTPTPQTPQLLRQADAVLAEWARPSAAWLSRHKRPGQTLVVRLHRYELDMRYPHEIDMDQVDAVVYVSPPIFGRIRDELGWPAEKLVYIPNLVDVDWLDRPKLPGARFGIGVAGVDFVNKRFDFMLDVLARVRREDPRFTMYVRTTLPWQHAVAWTRPEEHEYVGWYMERIERDPLLRGGVVFDMPGRDMASWYRKIGQTLSTSDIESFHLAAAEGMASGAVPVIRPWPGAREIYSAEWIQPSVDDAAAMVLRNADPDVWEQRRTRAKAEIRAAVDPVAAVAAWADLLHGDVRQARTYFGSYVPGAGA